MVDFVSVVHWERENDEIHQIPIGFVILDPWLER